MVVVVVVVVVIVVVVVLIVVVVVIVIVSLNGRRLRSPTRPHPAAVANGETGFLR